MSVDIGNAVSRASSITLTEEESVELEIVASHLAGQGSQLVDDQVWLNTARALSSHLPIRLRQTTRRFAWDAGDDAMLVLRNLPINELELPDTPARPGSVQRTSTVPASILVLIGFQLGEPIAFREEKSGALVQDVVPVPGMESFQGNAGSEKLTMHVENAFHDDRPAYVGLMCLRNDHDNIAGLQIASIRNAVSLLSERVRRLLFEPRFRTEPPGSFGGLSGMDEPHGILSGDRADPDIKVDFFSTNALDGEAEQAKAELRDALAEVRRTLILEPGDLAFVDNRLALHGRTSFQPRYDGRDRWLQRIFVSPDFRRSRALRPDNGHVLVSGV